MSKVLAPLLLAATYSVAQNCDHASAWRAASKPELAAILPARAQVIHERIETEENSHTGIVNARGQMVAATVLITAGYAAHGKYSHLFVTQTPVTLDGHLNLQPGSYLIGWDRGQDGLNVHLYRAENGEELGIVAAHPSTAHVTVVSIRVWPPRERNVIQIGRFFIAYQLC